MHCLFIRSLLVVMMFSVSIPLQGQNWYDSWGSEEQQKTMEDASLLGELYMLTYNDALMEELEIVDLQIEEIKKISESYTNSFDFYNNTDDPRNEIIRELREKGETEQANQLAQEQFKEANDRLQKHYQSLVEQVEEILLPHQMKRLRQILKQNRLQGFGQTDYLGLPYALADEIGLERGDKQKLKETTERVREEFNKKVNELRESSLEEILDELSSEEREAFKELVGDFYDSSQAMADASNKMFQEYDQKNKDSDDEQE